MKKYKILFYLFFSITSIYAQKNSLEVGISAFNHFEGYGFKVSRFWQKEKITYKGGPLRALTWSYECRLKNKNSILASFSTFSYAYQTGSFLYYSEGLSDRRFGIISGSYKQRLISSKNELINLTGQIGVDFRAGEDTYFGGFRDMANTAPWFASFGLTNLGTSIGISSQIKITKRVFINIRSNYVYYLIDLEKTYSGFSENRQILSTSLSLGYSF